mgnify:FL=1
MGCWPPHGFAGVVVWGDDPPTPHKLDLELAAAGGPPIKLEEGGGGGSGPYKIGYMKSYRAATSAPPTAICRGGSGRPI